MTNDPSTQPDRTRPDHARPDPADLGTTVPGQTPASGAELVRSEERLVTGVERHVAGSVRIGKRVVTEERTVTVTVRREELFVEHLPAGAATGVTGAATGETGAATGESAAAAPATGSARTDPGRRGHGAEPVVTLTLSEEEPVVTMRAVPRETVRLFVDRVTAEHAVTEDVAHEVVEHEVVEQEVVEHDAVERDALQAGSGGVAR